MELSRREVPLYGQAKVFALLQAPEPIPEEMEVFIVLEGSTLAHVIRAHSDVMLCFIVPGHNLAEVVSVHAYLCSETTPPIRVGGASLEYVQDDAQDLAEHLVTHGHALSSRDHRELSSLFCLGQESSRWAMDHRLALAMANLDIPHTWSVLGNRRGHDHAPRESPLHLAVRWGLCRLAELLLCQPGGLLAVSVPNEEGVTPLQLARRSGHRRMLELLTHPPNPLATPPAGLTQVWADRSRLLRYCHDMENLTLTVRQNRPGYPQQNREWSPPQNQNRHNDILLLRHRLQDEHFLNEIKSLKRGRSENVLEKEELVDEPGENGLYPECNAGGRPAAAEDVIEEPLMFCLSHEDEEDEESLPWETGEKSQSRCCSQDGEVIRPPACSSTLAAASRLAALIHGEDQVYANAMLVDQVDELDIKYRSPGEGEEVAFVPQRSSPRWDAFTAGSPPDPGPRLQDHHAWGGGGQRRPSRFSPSSPPPSPYAFPSSPDGQPRAPPSSAHRGRSFTEETSAHSSSLDVPGCDSGDEDILGHSYPSSFPRQFPALQSSSGEERDSFDTSPDFNRTLSDSTHTSAKDPVEAEVRLRSYSYSSPKARPSRPLLARDAAVSDLSEGGVCSSSGRSLLQALSLSKPLSLLQTGKQRTLSLTETAREKRVLGFRKRAQSAEEEGSASLQHLTLSEFLKEIEDEDWDKYIIPSKVESEKYKVSRTFSFLKSRMSSTRSKAKVKGKEGKEVKEGKEGRAGPASGHQFLPVSPSGPAACVACDKPVPGKDLLQCSYCSLSVHRNCRDSAAACGKKPQEKNTAAMLKNKTSSLPHMREVSPAPLSSSPSSSSLPLALSRDRRDAALPLAKTNSVPDRRMSDVVGVDSGEGFGGSVWPSAPPSEEGPQLSGTPPGADPPQRTIQETVDAPLLSDLSAELLGLEAESWSSAVDPEFCGKYDKRTVKRQDVIYELMQTELHHIQALCVMSEVFRRGMLEELQLDGGSVARVFPCLDPLLLFHRGLFSALQQRRQACAHAQRPHNYVIQRIGDVLLQQFSEESAARMKEVYGEFCSHHTEAVSLFKELQQQNKKFQVFLKQQSNNSLVRRREVPEFILLVTQRITKYPVLLERILQYTQEGSEEQAELSRALAQIREVIAAVDLSVNEYEKSQELQDVLARVENKTLAKMKNGKAFRKQDLLAHQRALQHKGLVYWKTATGRLKDTLSLLLTDVLVFLQEKDQRFVFAAVDQKPPVIPLQKLIVREVANEERGMFLISASSAGPEMYEIHTASREERNAWIRHIRQAVESCPEEEEEEDRSGEAEELRRAAEARVQKINTFHEALLGQDQRICVELEEKLQLYAELSELTLRAPEPLPQRHLLVSPETDGETPQQASALLTAALQEAEKLISSLQAQVCDPAHSSPVCGPEHCSYNSHGSTLESPSELDGLSTLSVSSTSLVSDGEWAGPDSLLWNHVIGQRRGDSFRVQLKVADSVQSLTQLLYSLQAAVTLQDSCYEVQRLLLLEGERPQLRPSSSCLHGNTVSLEQEKQRGQERRREEAEKKREEGERRSAERKREEAERRSVEKKREEVEGVQKLQVRLRHEQQRWDRECQAREKQQGEQESALERRERQCLAEAERLSGERAELEAQRAEYRQSLERLREGQRSVDRQRGQLDAQQRLLHSWGLRRRDSPPGVIPLDGNQDTGHARSDSLDGTVSAFVNEAALLQSLRQNHLQNQNQNHHHGLLLRTDQDGPAPPSTAPLPLPPSLYNSLNTLLSQTRGPPPGPEPQTTHQQNQQQHYCGLRTHPLIYQNQPSHGPPRPNSSPNNPFNTAFSAAHLGTNNNFSPPLDQLRSRVTGRASCEEEDYPAPPARPPLQPRLPLEAQTAEDAGEENIVYL